MTLLKTLFYLRGFMFCYKNTISFTLLLTVFSCTMERTAEIDEGDCVIGRGMNIWKLIEKDEGRYMFAVYPVTKDSPIEMVSDIKILKKVKCP